MISIPDEHSPGHVQALVRLIIAEAGDDPDRPGLVDTPERVYAMWREIFAGYEMKPSEVLKVFEDGGEGYDEMVLLRNCEFYSTCEHHLLPFTGVAHVAYVPSQVEPRIVGLSKLARLVDVFARRLQVQERLTTQVAEALMNHVQPAGAACVIEAAHMCMMCRGVRKRAGEMVTSCLRGVFRTKPEARAELFSLIRG